MIVRELFLRILWKSSDPAWLQMWEQPFSPYPWKKNWNALMRKVAEGWCCNCILYMTEIWGFDHSLVHGLLMMMALRDTMCCIHQVLSSDGVPFHIKTMRGQIMVWGEGTWLMMALWEWQIHQVLWVTETTEVLSLLGTGSLFLLSPTKRHTQVLPLEQKSWCWHGSYSF